MSFFKKLTEYLFYLFVFLLPWQAKLIWRPADTNFNEISLYVTHGLLILAIICFLIYKVSQGNRRVRINPVWYCLFGLETFIYISLWFAPDTLLALYRYLAFLVGLGLFYLLFEGAASHNYEDSFFSKLNIIYAFLSGLLIQAVLGIYQFLTQSSFAFKWLGLATHDPAALGTSVVETITGRWLRAYGGLDHPNILGGLLVIGLLLAAYQLAKKKMLVGVRATSESIFLFVFYFISLFALFFTFSRGAWLALTVGLIILLIHFIRQKDRWMLGRYIALLFFSAALAVTAVFPYYSLVFARLGAALPLEQKSLTERGVYLGQAEGLIKNQPWFGVGLGNYTKALADQKGLSNPTVNEQPVHDVFLLLWSESGLFALLSFLAFVFFLIKKDRREPFAWAILGALLILMLFDHWLFSLPFGVLILFFVFGLI